MVFLMIRTAPIFGGCSHWTQESHQDDEELRSLARQLSSDDIVEAKRRFTEWRLAHRTAAAELGISQIGVPLIPERNFDERAGFSF
jgi:hypothetical protein